MLTHLVLFRFSSNYTKNVIKCFLFSRATEFNPTNPSKKLKLDIPGFGDASPFMKAAKVEMERQQREVLKTKFARSEVY